MPSSTVLSEAAVKSFDSMRSFITALSAPTLDVPFPGAGRYFSLAAARSVSSFRQTIIFDEIFAFLFPVVSAKDLLVAIFLLMPALMIFVASPCPGLLDDEPAEAPVEKPSETDEFLTVDAQPNMLDEKNFIRELPIELIIKILIYLGPADRLSLSIFLFRKVEKSTVRSAPRRDREDFNDRIRRDNFPKLCQMERDESRWSFFTKTKRVCGGCKALHNADFFSRKQLSAPPEERVCRGREGRLQICEHRVLSFDWVKTHNHYGTPFRTCGHTDHIGADILTFLPPLSASPSLSHKCAELEYMGPCNSTRVDYTRVLFEVDKCQTLNLRETRMILTKFPLRLCPHLRLDDSDWLHKTAPLFSRDCDVVLSGSAQIDGVCPNKNCNTRITLSIKKPKAPHVNPDKRAVVVCVRRQLGALEDPCDPEWLAQVEGHALEEKEEEQLWLEFPKPC
ncbi:uncharacterized protein BKA78DRAFT_364169 [Phyllosticta capitalensis]|uniref:uncharacterized protein n=1 Tax=Phyllosticta capitalensis TaxID=121624 RepID=UPI00312DA3B2